MRWPITPCTSIRIVDLKKAFNIREGWVPEDDTLPRRFLSEGLPDGASKGAVIGVEQLQSMIKAYNLARGWTADGYLTADCYSELGIEDNSKDVPHKTSTAAE